MKKNISQKPRLTRKAASLAILVIATVLAIGCSMLPRVQADSIADQIKQLQAENAHNSDVLSELESQAVSYEDAINTLQAQIASLQIKINENTAHQSELQAQIVANQQELERQKEILGENIRVMYVDGQMSTIEMLATSKNLSDFVDKEEYRTAVKNKIQLTLKQIAVLQNQLNEQKNQVEALLKEQQAQQAQLAASRAEQSRMLTYNQSQQSVYNQKTKANQARIEDLIAQQRRANSSGAVPDGGYYFLRFSGTVRSHDYSVNDYPYASAGFSMSTLPGCGHPDPRTGQRDSTDRWGYCTRQCVSYAAWAVERSGRVAPEGYGSAKDWVESAPSSIIYRDPQPGDVAISTSGTWGHAMYVEKVDGNRIFVSQYNQQLNGEYSTQWRTFR
ncbi:MAG TPA: CHAP domain-containing protein [Candidatus Saccharimonadales bacterium]|nr:CHAP domain-containing protein [Candidatus Saccharimonadales bacterium]